MFIVAIAFYVTLTTVFLLAVGMAAKRPMPSPTSFEPARINRRDDSQR